MCLFCFFFGQSLMAEVPLPEGHAVLENVGVGSRLAVSVTHLRNDNVLFSPADGAWEANLKAYSTLRAHSVFALTLTV